MKAGPTIKRILFISVWILIGGGMLGLLLAAISTRNKGTIKDYVISFRNNEKNVFITTDDVRELLLNAVNGNMHGRPVSELKLQQLEQTLEHNSWIDKAELYFDNGNVLHVTVSEKKPIARIFTLSNQSFFIDSQGRKIPVSEQNTVKLPVFTGFPAGPKMKAADSALLQDIKTIANYIGSDPFWSAQVAQIDITGKKFEMIPMVGNHLVRLGDAQQVPQKMDRLLIFYRQVLSKSSFDKYKIIDVQYKGQVVASRSEGNHRIDSIQLRRNVDKLLKQSVEAEKDTVVKVLPIIKLEADSVLAADPSLHDQPALKNAENVDARAKQVKAAAPTPGKTPARKITPATKPVKIPEKKQEPKALMPKRTVENAADQN